MKLLILCPGKIPKSVDDISCFTDIVNYYLPPELLKISDCNIVSIPIEDNKTLRKFFSTVEVDQYDVILTLGLRYYSKISIETTNLIRSRFKGLFCQTYDGSRLNQDPVDVTFTFKDDSNRMSKNVKWFEKHKKYNEYMGWAADSKLNFPRQDSSTLRILVDHTNYGNNEIDKTKEVLTEIKKFIDSNIWNTKYKNISVRRFDSGKTVDVDLNNLVYEKYDRSKTLPYSEVSKEHCAAHVFCVTHPESVGLVVLETAMAGAFIVSPKNFIAKDRLETVRYYEWTNTINWEHVLKNINPNLNRSVALNNTWENVAKRIITAIENRKTIRRTH